jgi:DNA (cytosine-5)-methyltransferase 1
MLPSAVMGFLPTPRTSDTNGAGAHGDGGADLRTAVSLLPTPTSQAAKHGELSPIERDGNRPEDNGNLWVVVPRLAEEALLPTPAVNDMGEGKTLEWWDDWAPRQKSSDGRPAPHGKSLAIEALRASHGATTAPPSPDGNESSDDPHQPQLSLDVQGIPA